MQRYGHFFVTSQHSTVTANIMLLFPNAKINIGLHIGHTRPDGYHDIATAMLPVHWCDILEILPAVLSHLPALRWTALRKRILCFGR